MLGHKLVQRWRDKFDVWTTVRGEFAALERFGIFDRDKTVENLSVLDTDSLRAAVEKVRPDVIFNAVGIVKQIPTAKNTVATLLINAVVPHQIAEISAQVGARLIQISTDCVFEGTRGMYREEDRPDATDLYGKSKHLGEVTGENCLTVRTSIIGRELATSHGLVEWLLGNRGKSVKGYANAIFSGFPTLVLADIISHVIEDHPSLYGLFHVSSDPIDKFTLLNLINDRLKLDIVVERFEDVRIDRSLDSSLFRKATGFTPETWPEMIERMVRDETPYDAWRIVGAGA